MLLMKMLAPTNDDNSENNNNWNNYSNNKRYTDGDIVLLMLQADDNGPGRPPERTILRLPYSY